jgi:hypothetical protein
MGEGDDGDEQSSSNKVGSISSSDKEPQADASNYTGIKFYAKCTAQFDEQMANTLAQQQR